MEPKFIKAFFEGFDPDKIIVFDVETNGYLEQTDRLHVLSIRDTCGGEPFLLNQRTGLEDGLRLIQERATAGWHIAGHNAIGFDIPAIQKVYPWFQVPKHRVIDTLVMSYLMFTDLKRTDLRLWKRGKLPGQLIGRHSLESWGHRLCEYKGDFQGPFTEWTQEMEDYCHQDTLVTLRLLQEQLRRWLAFGQSVAIEHGVKWVDVRRERNGIHFDEAAAWDLVAKLKRRQAELAQDIATRAEYRPFYLPGGVTVPKITARRQTEELGLDSTGTKFKTMDFTKGAPYTKVVLTHFKPSSNMHVAYVLQRRLGWQALEFTEEIDRFGQPIPKLDEPIMAALDFPGVETLKEYFVVDKRLGQIAEGQKAWLARNADGYKFLRDGRLYSRMLTCGTVTGRAAHLDPNLGQTPASYSPYGTECRALFGPRLGWQQVGCDADGLEARDFAGYLVPYDGGAYVRALLEGDKAAGTDNHSTNARALGLDPKAYHPHLKAAGRDVAKTFLYAFLYGAGDEKLGIILTGRRGRAAIDAGSTARARFLKNMPGLKKLVDAVKAKARERGYLIGLDGRRLVVRSQHAALNTLLQSAGAVQMKVAMLLLDEALEEDGLYNHAEWLLWVHDEFQLEAEPNVAPVVGRLAAESIKAAGDYLRFKCPLSGSFQIGNNWAECH